jgi:hypothetical protein
MTRSFAAVTLVALVPIFLVSCKEEEQPPPQTPVQPAPAQPVQTGLSVELQAKVANVCMKMQQCKLGGQAGADYQSCQRDLGQPASYQGTCGNQHVALIECINNLQTCDQSPCALQSAAVTACGSGGAGLFRVFLGQ